jgi:oligo-1,6-glucosidase
MQWDDSHQAGFTSGEPWIKVNSNYLDVNVKKAQQDKDSILHYYKKLISLRKQEEVFVYGEYKLYLPLDPDLYVYTRTLKEDQLLIVLNFFDRTPVFNMPKELDECIPELLLSNYAVNENELDSITLRPYESRVYRLTKPVKKGDM